MHERQEIIERNAEVERAMAAGSALAAAVAPPMKEERGEGMKTMRLDDLLAEAEKSNARIALRTKSGRKLHGHVTYLDRQTVTIFSTQSGNLITLGRSAIGSARLIARNIRSAT
jgi:hypothetical protein